MRQGRRNDEAECLEQLLAKVIVETWRDSGERTELAADGLVDPRIVVTEQRRAAVRRQVEIAAILVIPDVCAVTAHETEIPRRATQFIEPPIWKNRGHSCLRCRHSAMSASVPPSDRQ